MIENSAPSAHPARPARAPQIVRDAPPAEFRGYPVLARRLSIGGREIQLCGPANYHELTDTERVARRFAIDEYMPYWADVWPGALMLAEEVATWPTASAVARSKPPVVLELGCGLGLVGLIAADRGYDVICGDYDEDALAFAELNARINGISPPRVCHMDWRETYPDIRADRIVAADVLYESRSLLPIADFIARHLSDAPDAVALLSDPNRSTADAFDGIARHSGLSVETAPREWRSGGPGERSVAGRIFSVRRKRQR